MAGSNPQQNPAWESIANAYQSVGYGGANYIGPGTYSLSPTNNTLTYTPNDFSGNTKVWDSTTNSWGEPRRDPSSAEYGYAAAGGTPTPSPTPPPSPTGVASLADRQTFYAKGGGSETGAINYGISQGMTPAQIDAMFGWTSGTSASKATPTPTPTGGSTYDKIQAGLAGGKTYADMDRELGLPAGSSYFQGPNGQKPGFEPVYEPLSVSGWATPKPTPTPSAAPVFNLGNMQQSTDWVVDPKTQTVAGQLEKVIASDSPLLQQARARARQEAAQRGLLNSSMAETGADSALYDTALKIATPDAGTYADAAKTNAGSRNQFSLQANDFTGRGALAQYQTAAQEWLAQNDFGRQTQRDATLNQYDLGKIDRSGVVDLAKLAAQSGYDLQKLGAAGQIDLAKLQAAGQIDLNKLKVAGEIDATKQTKADDSAALRQAGVSATSVMQTMQNALADLDKMEGLDPATRSAMANSIKSNARAALQIVGAVSGDIDIASYMDALFVEDTPKDPNAVRPGNVTAAGPQADVAAVFKEADRLAALNGTTRAQEIWKWANAQNYSDAEMDIYFGQPAGTAAQVRKQLGK